MGIKLQRGHVENITPSGKNGAVDCQIRDHKIKVHPYLADKFGAGDDVLVAGELKNNVLHAMAVNNFKQDKIAHIDCTNYILILGVSGYVGIMAGVFGLEGSGGWVTSLQDVTSIIGLAIAALAIRRVVVVNRASNCVRYPELADEASGKA
jgi:hypothetical protein